MMMHAPLGRVTHGGRHGFLLEIYGGWMTVAFDADTVDADEYDPAEDPKAYWMHPNGQIYYTVEIPIFKTSKRLIIERLMARHGVLDG